MSKRRSIVIEGFRHGTQPIPAASVVRNVLMTGGVHGLDPETGKPEPDPVRQVALMFQHLEAIMRAAGGSMDDIVKLDVYASDRAIRATVNDRWVELFPDEAARPARHTFQYDHLPAGILVQCVATAVLGD